MSNATSSSNPSFIVNVGEVYPYPSLITPNIVTVKLSGKNKYNMWKTQMLCLLKSHQMHGFIDGQFPRPAEDGKGKVEDMEAWIISDSLVKGWILGSLSEEAFNKVVNHLTHMQKKTDFTAKDLWDELQCSYGPRVREQAAETKITTRQAESVIEVSSIPEDAKSKDEPTEEKTKKGKLFEILHNDFNKRWLYKSILKGNTDSVIHALERFGLRPWDKLTNNGNTVLHVAVGSSTENHELLKKLLELTPTENTLLDLVNSNGSNLLHVAAIGGNIEVVDILVERNPELLLAKDNEGHTPLALSVSNMHIKTSHRLFEHMKEHGDGNLFSGQSGEDLVVLAISCQDFRLANMIINDYPDAILSDSNAVLTALAQNFPRELNFWERGLEEDMDRMTAPCAPTPDRIWKCLDWSRRGLLRLPFKILIKLFILFLIVYILGTVMFYRLLKVLVRPFFEDTIHIHEDATNLLSDVSNKILTKDNASTYHHYYTTSTFEATRRNTSTFIRCIMRSFPDAIWSTNEDGHNFIQYSVIKKKIQHATKASAIFSTVQLLHF